MNLAQLLVVFSPPSDPALLTYGTYNGWLVTLSILTAIFSSWMALQLASQAAATNTRPLRMVVLLTGSLALGSGVWAMHFIGMLAFNLCTEVEYQPTLTICSMLPSIGASFVALSLIGRQRIDLWQLLTGGLLVGAGIGAMHYTGMAALHSALELRYDPAMFGLSIVVAVVLATLALWVQFGLRGLGTRMNKFWLLPISAVVMGFAIAGMHYTGMAAARFVGEVTPGAVGGTGNASFIALAIALITIAFTILVLAANGMLRYRQMNLQLRHSESWMRTLLSTAVDGVVTIDANGMVRGFNAAAERIFGWPQAEIVGQDVRKLIADPEASEREGLLQYLLARESRIMGQSSETLIVRKDGATVAVRTAYGHARLGGSTLFVCFVTDISERKAMEQALRDSEQQFRSLIGNIPGISYRCLMQPGWPMIFISDAIERLSGYPAEDFTGATEVRRFESLIHPDDRQRVAFEIEAAVSRGTSFVIEYRLLHRDGRTIWMWEHGCAALDEDGKVKWLDGVVLDISERHVMEDDLRNAKERAEQGAEARAAFLANMSHEIRTPMNSIVGFTEVLLHGALAPEQRRHLESVRGAAGSLLRLLNEVLDTAKLDKGAMELVLTDFNLLGLIDELSSTMGQSAQAAGLELTIRYDSRLPLFFHGDELRVRQVLTNLLGNAIKFTETGGVTLEVEPQIGQVHLVVRDTGIGIEAERMAAIFEPFVQADASMSRRFGGTGLGTTISKQLTELMGGRIWAESTPGRGSAFHVLLPLAPARTLPANIQKEASITVLPPLHILVADDVPQNVELLSLLLGRLGHTVVSASDGTIAVELAATEGIDIILMDVQMPGMSGLEATRRIREAEAASGSRRVPVIAMTASVLDADRAAAQRAGMDGFAAKPVNLAMLTFEIARVLGIQHAGEADDRIEGPPQVLDLVRALQRWGGERMTYHRALRRFDTEYAGTTETLQALLATDDVSMACGQVHKVKGAAANLGLELLAAVLERLEHALERDDQHARAAALAELPVQLAAARKAISAEAGRPAPALPAQSIQPPDAQYAEQLGETLMQSIKRGALDDAALSRFTDALAGHVETSRFAELQQALDNFDFIAAQASLASILSALKIVNAEPQ